MSMLLACLVFVQDNAATSVAQAIEKTGLDSYSYRVAGKYERSGEFRPEAILTCTIRRYRSARNGTRILVKGPEGLWKPPDRRLGEQVQNPDRDAADIVATLRDAEPPHRMLRDTLALCEKGTGGEEKTIEGRRCRVWWFRLRDPELKAALERQMKKGDLPPPDSVHWASARSSLRVSVDAAEVRLVRFVDERSVKIGYLRLGTEETRLYKNEMEFTFSGWGRTSLDLPKEVAEKLEIRE